MKVLLTATVQSHIAQFHKPLMKLLKERGWQVHVAARDNLAEKNGLALEYPDKVFDVPFQRSPFDERNLTAYRELKRLLEAERYDVIHCNTPVGGLLTRLAARRYRKQGTKVYYTAHGFHFYKGAPRKNWLVYYPVEKWLSRYTDKLITIANEDYELARARLKCPVYRIHGVGANSAKFEPLSEEEQSTRKTALGLTGRLILNVGELLPNKNQKTAIHAMKLLVPRFPDARLLIAGNGPERESLEKQIEDEGLQDHVTLLGYTTQLERYMQICDVLIACSYREGQPLNVMEAMLCGKPVVASRNRGHCELVREGVTGYLVDADDAAAYADRIAQIFTDEHSYKEAALSAVRPYTSENIVRELEVIYGV